MCSTFFTPGPWQLARFDESTCFIEVETVERGDDLPDQGYTIAKMYAGPKGPIADNHLVAASPELYQALEELLEYANRYSDKMAEIGRGANGLGELADSETPAGRAKRALALARGDVELSHHTQPTL